MPAIITILKQNSSESIQMHIKPNELIKNILERCTSYWCIEEKGDHVLMHGNTILDNDKLVIDSELQEGDVVRLCQKDKEKEQDESVPVDYRKEKDPVEVAKRWLANNIGLEDKDITLINRVDSDDGVELLFKNNNLEEHYTLRVSHNRVKKYVPALTDRFVRTDN